MPKIPKFDSDLEEAGFWDTHDSTDFFDATVEVDEKLVDARPRKTLISLRLEPEIINQLKVVAHRRGIGYQTLIRMWIMEQLALQSDQTVLKSEARPAEAAEAAEDALRYR